MCTVFKFWSILLIYTLKNQTDQLHLLIRFDLILEKQATERRNHLFLNIYLLQEDGINNNKFQSVCNVTRFLYYSIYETFHCGSRTTHAFQYKATNIQELLILYHHFLSKNQTQNSLILWFSATFSTQALSIRARKFRSVRSKSCQNQIVSASSTSPWNFKGANKKSEFRRDAFLYHLERNGSYAYSLPPGVARKFRYWGWLVYMDTKRRGVRTAECVRAIGLETADRR